MGWTLDTQPKFSNWLFYLKRTHVPIPIEFFGSHLPKAIQSALIVFPGYRFNGALHLQP